MKDPTEITVCTNGHTGTVENGACVECGGDAHLQVYVPKANYLRDTTTLEEQIREREQALGERDAKHKREMDELREHVRVTQHNITSRAAELEEQLARVDDARAFHEGEHQWWKERCQFIEGEREAVRSLLAHYAKFDVLLKAPDSGHHHHGHSHG